SPKIKNAFQIFNMFTYIDKLLANFAIVCKKHYLQQLYKEYHTPTYIPSSLSHKEICQLHNKALSVGIKFDSRIYHKVACAYTSVKVTKPLPDVRFIAG